VIAKGTRNPKNKYYGLIQHLGNYEIVIYRKDTSLSLLKEISLIDDHSGLTSDFTMTVLAHAGAELYLQLMFEEDDYKKFYILLAQFYTFLPTVKKIIFWFFGDFCFALPASWDSLSSSDNARCAGHRTASSFVGFLSFIMDLFAAIVPEREPLLSISR